MIAIIDYGIGNLASVANMLKRIGVRAEITSDPTKIESADALILPGNGSFDGCMERFRATDFATIVEDRVLNKKVKILGICVGAQMLGKSSEEGDLPGLGWIDMTCKKFPDDIGVRVPHMGWNHVHCEKENHSLLQNFDESYRFYFAHRYYLEPANQNDVLLTCEYGFKIAVGVEYQNITGVQFHPEKSHRYGKSFLSNFVQGL